MRKITIIIFLAINIMSGRSFADVVGSDTSPSSEPFYLFPDAPVVANRIANYAWMQGGFGLQSAATNLLFDSVFPVSGVIALNNGTITLNRDLIMSNITTIESLGTIVGNGHTLSLSPTVTWLPAQTATFSNIKLVLNSDVIVKGPLSFIGSCVTNNMIQGNGHRLILDPDPGSLVVSGILTVQNVILEGIAGSNIQLLTDSSVLKLDNVTWIQDGDVTFTHGSLVVNNLVTMQGPWTFAYQTSQSSFINQNGILLLDDGFTFSYDPSSSLQNLLSFVDETSLLILNGATLHASVTGLQLTNGSLKVMSNSFFSSETQLVGTVTLDNGITLGDGNVLHDFMGAIAPQAQLKIVQGSLNYRNRDAASWIMGDSVSNIFFNPSSTLRLYETLHLGSGLAKFEDNTTLARVPAAILDGSITALGVLNFVIM